TDMSSEAYELEKSLWTDADFDRMGWHDNPVHAVAFGPGEQELTFDIDYIFKWEEPLPGERYYRFWISPATLTFESVIDLNISHDAYVGLTILEITRELSETPDGFRKPLWKWTLACVEGAWQFRASGYRQFIRRPPVLCAEQCLGH